jgi:hypothetical protein
MAGRRAHHPGREPISLLSLKSATDRQRKHLIYVIFYKESVSKTTRYQRRKQRDNSGVNSASQRRNSSAKVFRPHLRRSFASAGGGPPAARYLEHNENIFKAR